MKTKILLKMGLIAMCFMAGFVEMGAQELFQKEYGYQNRNSWVQQSSPLTIVQTIDSGFVALSFGGAINGIGPIILKTNEKGNTEWCKIVKVFPSGDNVRPSAIIQTLDSGFCVVGRFISSQSLPFLFKIDKFGNKLWLKIYGDTLVNFGDFRSIAEGNDGSLYLSGARLLYKTDENGNLMWAKKYSESGSTIQKTNDGNFVRAGSGLTKIDTAGNILWSQKYFESASPGNYLTTLQNGGYLLATNRGPIVIKTDSLGNVEWSKNYSGGSSYCGGIQELERGLFLIASSTNFGIDAYDSWFLITDSLGNILTSKFPQKGEDIIFSVKRTYDSGFVAEVGHGYVGDKASLLKVDKNSMTSCPENERVREPLVQDYTPTVTTPTITDTLLNITASEMPCEFLPVSVTETNICTPTDILEENKTKNFKIFPNPATGVCTILLKENIQNADVAIIDINGKTLYRKFLKNAGGEIMLDISPLQPGVYFVKVIADGREFIQKMIVE